MAPGFGIRKDCDLVLIPCKYDGVVRDGRDVGSVLRGGVSPLEGLDTKTHRRALTGEQ